jgi:hypothetical protein
MSACESSSGWTVRKKTEKEVINAINRRVRARECENGLGCVDNRVLNIIMKIRSTESPFILRSQRLSDFAAIMIGIRQPRMINSGMIDRNRRDTTARTMDMKSLARGSSL